MYMYCTNKNIVGAMQKGRIMLIVGGNYTSKENTFGFQTNFMVSFTSMNVWQPWVYASVGCTGTELHSLKWTHHFTECQLSWYMLT